MAKMRKGKEPEGRFTFLFPSSKLFFMLWKKMAIYPNGFHYLFLRNPGVLTSYHLIHLILNTSFMVNALQV